MVFEAWVSNYPGCFHLTQNQGSQIAALQVLNVWDGRWLPLPTPKLWFVHCIFKCCRICLVPMASKIKKGHMFRIGDQFLFHQFDRLSSIVPAMPSVTPSSRGLKMLNVSRKTGSVSVINIPTWLAGNSHTCRSLAFWIPAFKHWFHVNTLRSRHEATHLGKRQELTKSHGKMSRTCDFS